LKGLDGRINESLDILIKNEALIGYELRSMLKSFKEEKKEVGYSFGEFVIGIMKHLQIV